MTDIRTRIDYARNVLLLSEKGYGIELGLQYNTREVPQWEVSRWRAGLKPPAYRMEQINGLYLRAIGKAFGSPNGFRYICNIGERYESDQMEESLTRLQQCFIEHCPGYPPSGLLHIAVLPAPLPPDIDAQVFKSSGTRPMVYFVLVRPDEEWKLNARDEIFAHIFTPEGAPGLEIREP